MSETTPSETSALLAALAELLTPPSPLWHAETALARTEADLNSDAVSFGLTTVFSNRLSAVQRQLLEQSSLRDELIALAVNAAGMSPRAVAVATGLHHSTVVSRAEDPRNQTAVRRAKALEAQHIARRDENLPSAVLPQNTEPSRVPWHAYALPLGLTTTYAEATWRPTRDGHLLIIGGTGTGKTTLIHHIIQQLLASGVEVWALDGTLIGFIGYSRDWPNIGALPLSHEAQIASLRYLFETMMERYAQVREGTNPNTFPPIVIVMDGAESILSTATELYRARRAEGSPTRPPARDWLAQLLSLGRAVRMHLVIAQQRLDTAVLDDELRDNFGQRISLGALRSRDTALWLWDDPRLTRSAPYQSPGRGLVSFANEPVTFQAAWGAAPDADPAALPHPSLAPDPLEAGSTPRVSFDLGEKDKPTWDDITAATPQTHGPTPGSHAPDDGYQQPAPLQGFADWSEAIAARIE